MMIILKIYCGVKEDVLQ